MKITQDSIQIFYSDLNTEAQMRYLEALDMFITDKAVQELDQMAIAEIPIASTDPTAMMSRIFERLYVPRPKAPDDLKFNKHETKEDKVARWGRLSAAFAEMQRKELADKLITDKYRDTSAEFIDHTSAKLDEEDLPPAEEQITNDLLKKLEDAAAALE